MIKDSTTIRISRQNKDSLVKLGGKNESYNTIIERLIIDHFMRKGLPNE